MKKICVLIFAMALLAQGLQANTCATATSLTIKSTQAPDTFQFSGTEYWYAFTGSSEATFYINNSINGTYAGINQIDLYSGSCGSLTSLLSKTNIDTLTMFRYTFVNGNQYYLKLTRPSGLITLNFSVYGSTWVKAVGTPCNYEDCQFIRNGSFNLTPGMNYDGFWNTPPSQFHDYFICGWRDAWGTPNLLNVNNLMAFIWSLNDAGGEAIVHDMSARQLTPTQNYTLSFDYYATGIDGGDINFILSTLGIGSYFLPNSNSLYVTGTFSNLFNTAVITGQWIHVNQQIQCPALQPSLLPYLTLVIDPQSNSANPLRIILDNISITESFTATITANPPVLCSGGSVLTANPNQNPANPPYTYLWNTGATTQTININTSDNFSVTVTNGIGCTSVATIKPLELSDLNATTTASNTDCGICNGSIDLTVTGGTAPYTYHWTDADNNAIANTQDISSLCAGEYYVTVTDAIGCTWGVSQVVIEDVFANSNWPKITYSSGNEEIYDLTIDINGNVYAIGLFDNSLTLGSSTYTVTSPSRGIFVVKYDYCGNVITSKYIGKIQLDYPDLHIEYLSNRIIVAGDFYRIDCTGTGNVINANGSSDVFLATLDPTTLVCNANQQVIITSSGTDLVKGISAKSNAIHIAGVFSGTTLSFSNSTTTLTLAGGSGDLFVCRFLYTLASMNWAQSYQNIPYDRGFTLQTINSNYTPFFTYMINGTSFIARLNSSTGAIVSSAQIGNGGYYEIYDMINYSNSLYLCGYYKPNFTLSPKQASLIYYPTPLTSIAWSSATSLVSEATTGNLCEATKLALNGTDVFVSGTYNYSGFRIGNLTNWSQAISVYGATNHFVYKTTATLNSPATGWLSGVEATYTGTSRGNALYYDAAHSVYYMGGAFNGQVELTGAANQTMTAYTGGYDGFIARFKDNSGADYARLAFFKDSLSKVENSDVIVYPNPSNGNFTIASIKNEAITNVSVSDLTGRVVFKKNFENEIFETNSDLSFLPASTYFISISTTKKVYNNKLVIVK